MVIENHERMVIAWKKVEQVEKDAKLNNLIVEVLGTVTTDTKL